MHQMPSHPAIAEQIESLIVRQAAEVAARAVQVASSHARLAAARCGCATCRANDRSTRLWALAMAHRPLPTAPDAEAA